MSRLSISIVSWALVASAGCSSTELPEWTPPELNDIEPLELDASTHSAPVHDAATLNHARTSDAAADGSATITPMDESKDDQDDAAATETVSIRFKAKVGDRDFACAETYPSLGSTGVAAEPADLRFFVQDLRLVDETGREEPVKLTQRSPWQTSSVALIDFEDKKAGCRQGNELVNDRILGKVRPGNYVGIVFRNGVPEDVNHADPTRQPAPLQQTDLTWDWLTGFKFFLAELHQVAEPEDADGGVAEAPLGVGLVHVGSTGCTGDPLSGSTACKHSNRNEIRLTPFNTERNSIVVDVAALFMETDISVESQCHSTDDACDALFARLGLDFATGRSTQTQSVYHVE